MLKIWLTWLQPSLGVLGTALVLSNPLCAYAASKPAAVRNPTTTKTPTQVSQWSAMKLNGTRIDSELSSGIALTPDMAVRRLAMNSTTASGLPSSINSKLKTPQIGGNPVASFVSPSVTSPKASVKASKQAKPQYAKNSVAAALAQAINPQAPLPVPGLYIGNSNTRVASNIVPTGKAVTQPIAATEIGAPTPLSAMMAAKTAIDPYPVVRPELMQKLDRNPVAIKTKTAPVVDLSPIASIPTTKPQAVVPKTILPQAKANPAAAPYKSLDPIANIPSGLQQLLGNNLNSQPVVASASTAKTKVNKANSLVALRQLIAPSTPALPSVNAASLQLATAQAYTANVPKFSIPGETMLSAKQFTPARNLVVTKRIQKKFSTIVASSQRDYTTTLAPNAKQPWMVVDRRNSLGGLILGSQPLTSAPQVASLLPVNTSNVGLPARNLVNFN